MFLYDDFSGDTWISVVKDRKSTIYYGPAQSVEEVDIIISEYNQKINQ